MDDWLNEADLAEMDELDRIHDVSEDIIKWLEGQGYTVLRMPKPTIERPPRPW